MKKVVSIVSVCLLLALLLTACGKSAITAEEFKAKAVEAGLEVKDNTDATVEKGYAQKEYDVKHSSDGWVGHFYEFEDEERAKKEYADLKESIDDYYTGVSSSVSTDTSYAITSDGEYFYLSRAGKTVWMALSDEEKSESLKEFNKKIGY